MELHQLRTFVAVAEEGHLTRAAERMFVSQPAVSSHVKALEAELGVALFDRTPKGMRLTREGERLLGRARRIVRWLLFGIFTLPLIAWLGITVAVIVSGALGDRLGIPGSLGQGTGQGEQPGRDQDNHSQNKGRIESIIL